MTYAVGETSVSDTVNNCATWHRPTNCSQVHCCITLLKIKTMSSSNLPLRASQDGCVNINSSASPESTADGDDLLLLSNLQLNEDCPLQAGSNTSELPDRGTTIDDLPDELMLEIFSYVSSSENIVLQKVCTRWKILAEDTHLWHNQKYVVSYKTCEEEAIATFAAMPQLRTVILGKEVSPEVIKALSKSCPHLTTLEMNYMQTLTYSEVDNLFDGCKKIRALTISEASIREDMRLLPALARLADLRVLHLLQLENTDTEISLHILADCCPHLCDLDLGKYYGLRYQIRDAEYFINSQKRILKCLRIRWASVEGRNIVPLLPCAEMLQNLELTDDDSCGLGVSTEAFTILGQLHSLRQLGFSVNGPEVRHFVPAVFGYGGLSNLQQLSLEGHVVDETTRVLAEHCPELRELELSHCEGHTDTLFEPLCQLRKLEILKLCSCRSLSGKTMSYIAKLPVLHTLEFSYIKFGRLKPSLDCILEMSELRQLSLRGSICFDIPFEKFPGRLVNLRELEIDCSNGDQTVLDRICAQMPELKVKGCFEDLFTSEEEDYEDDYGDDHD